MILIFHEKVTILITGIVTGDRVQGVPRNNLEMTSKYCPWFLYYFVAFIRQPNFNILTNNHKITLGLALGGLINAANYFKYKRRPSISLFIVVVGHPGQLVYWFRDRLCKGSWFVSKQIQNRRLLRCCLFSHSFMDSTVTPFSNRALSKFEREVLNLLNKSYSFPKGLLNNVAGNLSIIKTLN